MSGHKKVPHHKTREKWGFKSFSQNKYRKYDLPLSFQIDKGDEILMVRLPDALVLPGAVEGWPSGQWQQTVNLPGFPYVGSNPTPSTIHLISREIWKVYVSVGTRRV